MTTWAAIFDWDGVILDSSRQHERAWEQLAAERDAPLPEGFFLRSFGMKNEKAIRELLEWSQDPAEIQQLSRHKEALYRELIGQNDVQPLPGVVALLESLRAAGVPCAVGSSTPRANLDCVLPQLGVAEYFRVIICAEDVVHGKPDPEVFLTAAKQLAVPPERCVVFEDAHVGIAAARAAGMKVAAVATTHPASTLEGADRVVASLEELTVTELSQWFAG